jgi:hypothetical protein
VSDLFEMEMEPDRPPAEPDAPIELLAAAVPSGGTDALAPARQAMPIESVLQGLNLAALLTFLPDVNVKKQVDARAAEARALVVSGRAGLKKADAVREALRVEIAKAVTLFDGTKANPGPTALANMLHKRMTGLRGEWTKDGDEALADLDRRIARETRSVDAASAAAAAKEQEKADAQARADAARAAEVAKTSGAGAPFVEALERQAETAVAPPVPVTPAAAAMSSTGVTEKNKMRLAGTPDDAAEPQPKMADLTDAQRKAAIEMARAVGEGELALSCFEINWSTLNRWAEGAPLGTYAPGLEVFKAQSVRSRGRRS